MEVLFDSRSLPAKPWRDPKMMKPAPWVTLRSSSMAGWNLPSKFRLKWEKHTYIYIHVYRKMSMFYDWFGAPTWTGAPTIDLESFSVSLNAEFLVGHIMELNTQMVDFLQACHVWWHRRASGNHAINPMPNCAIPVPNHDWRSFESRF